MTTLNSGHLLIFIQLGRAFSMTNQSSIIGRSTLSRARPTSGVQHPAAPLVTSHVGVRQRPSTPMALRHPPPGPGPHFSSPRSLPSRTTAKVSGIVCPQHPSPTHTTFTPSPSHSPTPTRPLMHLTRNLSVKLPLTFAKFEPHSVYGGPVLPFLMLY